MILTLLGCKAQLPDVGADAARLSGLDNAIVFRENAESFDAAPPSDRALSAPQAVRLALAHDPRIQAALARVRMAEADADQARLVPNPILTIDIRTPLHGNSPTAFEPTLTADLVALLSMPGKVAAADHRLRASAADALTTTLDIISEVQIAYASARSIDQEIDNAQRRDKILQHLREIAQKRLDVGDSTKLDVLTIDTQIVEASLDLADLRQQQTEQRLLLARLIGQPRAATNWELSPWQAPSTAPLPSESAWLDAALHNRPEISSRVWELLALGEDFNSAALAPFVGTTLGPHFEHDGLWRGGPTLTVPLPIFDWGQAARAKVDAQRVAAIHDLSQQQAEIIQDVRLAYASYLQSRDSLVLAQDKLLPLQRQQLEQSQRAYQNGDIDLATLLQAETGLELTLSKIVELQEKVTAARVKLERAAGGAGIAHSIEAVANEPAPTLPAAETAPATKPAASPPTSQPATGSKP